MRVAITGASGFLGRQIIPLLLVRQVSLLLIGRQQPGPARSLHGLPVLGYDQLASAGAGLDAVVHLAVLNNDQPADLDSFVRVNCDLAVQTCLDTRNAGVRTFIYISSTHALDESNQTPYAVSKRMAAERLQAIDGIAVHILYLPFVIDRQGGSRFKALGRLPTPLRNEAWSLIQSLKPTVTVERVADAIMSRIDTGPRRDRRDIVVEPQDDNRIFGLVKRLIDLGLALAVLLALWWLMIIVWAAIRLQSTGPGLFVQQRVGKNQKLFNCYKFRTMLASTPDIGTHEVSASVVTTLGHFLRRTKIDELPQVFNVLRNEMSFVGPRPCLPSQTELTERRRANGIFDVLPGITGLAQVQGVDMSNPERITALDHQYVCLRGLVLDMRILWATVRGKGGGDRVRRAEANR